MPTTRITNNSLAANAALNNLNAGASITFTKPVSISGNLTVDTNTLFVDSVNNRVGVGTASPQYILDIGAGDVNVGNGSALRWGGNFGIQATSGAMRIDGGAQHIRLTSTGDVSRLYINCSNGNVGIGTTTPNERLTVSGNLSATGTVIASNYNPASNVAEFLASPTSDNLRAAVTGETGTDALVFANGPTITSPTIAGTAQFTGTSRPTSTATETPSASELITLADGDTRYGEFLISNLTADGVPIQSQTTLQNTGCELTLGVGTWLVQGQTHVTNANTAAQLKFAGTLTGGIQDYGNVMWGIGNVGVPGHDNVQWITGGRSLGNSIRGWWKIEGLVRVTSGTATIRTQYAQNVSTAADTIVRAGTHLIARRLKS